MRPSRLVCLGALVLALAWSTPYLAGVPAAAPQDDAVEVPYILWGGDVATFLANGGLTTKDGSVFAKQGLKLKLTRGDDFPKQVKNYVEGKSPFLRGTMSMLGLVSEEIGKDEKTRPVVFLQLTWSAGDHLVARAGLKTLGDLKGKKIALQKAGPHVGMLDDILHTAKLDWKDLTVVWTDDVTGDKGPSALFRKDNTVDGCFAITPDMSDLTGGLKSKGNGEKGTIKGAHVLVSTADMKRSIADVYACRKDYYDAHKEQIEKFAAGYLKGCEDLVAMRKLAQDKKDNGKFKALLQMTQDIFGKDDIKTLDDADGLIADAVFVGLPGNHSFFTVAGNLSGFKAKAKGAIDLAVGQGYAKKRYEFLKANLDYARLKKVGGLTTDPEESSAGFAESAKLPTATSLSDNTLYFFTIGFDANQKVFEEEKYRDDFQRALEQASLFGNSMIAVRGHGDLVKILNEFVKTGLAKGTLRRVGSPGKYEFFTKDGKKLDLGDTKRVIELIDKGDFADQGVDAKRTLKAVLQLSQERAEAVRNALIAYAQAKKIVLDKNQIQAVGVGITEPVVPQPRSEDQMARNRRVEFRIVRVSAEALTVRSFDY